jgi:CRP/FNR family transcriptional activator FtrB
LATKIEIGRIRSVPLFGKLAEEDLRRLAASASLRQVPARAVLFTEGGRPDGLHSLMRGVVELYGEHDDRRFTVAVVGALKPFVLPLALADRNPFSARTLEPCELLVVPTQMALELFSTNSEFARAVAHELAGECETLIEEFKSHRMRTTIERVARWILRRDEDAGGTGRFVIPYDKRVLASYLGMAPEHLSRSFSALASAGVVVRGRSITLTDRSALIEVAGLTTPELT